MGKYRYDYESWPEFVEAALGKTDMPSEARSSRTNPRSPQWDLNMGWGGAKQAASGGWADGQDEVTIAAAELTRKITQMVEEVTLVWDVTGEFVDVGAYLDGEPECFGSFQMEEVERPIVSILYNVCASGGVPASVLKARGTAVLSLVNALEAAGRRVELTIAMGNGWDGKNSHLDLAVVVKKPNESLNPGLAAFVTVHPAMFRRLVFSWMETLPKDIRSEFHVTQHGGYGMPSDHPDKDEADIYIGSAMYGDAQWTDPKSAEKWVLDRLREQGVVLTEEAYA